MSWRLVARKDFADAVRSRMLWGIVGVSVGLVLVIVFAFGANAAEGETTPTVIMTLFGSLGGQLVLPIVALVVGYRSVVGERQSGSLLVLQGLSHSRRDVVLGKLVGRAVVVASATTLAFAVGGAVIVALFGRLPVVTFVAFTALTALFSVTMTAIAVGISAATATRGRAMAGAIGSYLVFVFAWTPIVAAVNLLLTGGFVGYVGPAWYFLLKRLSPGVAYLDGANALIDGSVAPLVGWYNVVETVPAGSDPYALADRITDTLPFYLDGWFVVAILAGWIVLAVGFGYWRFERADLA